VSVLSQGPQLVPRDLDRLNGRDNLKIMGDVEFKQIIEYFAS
jgi:hypothetical protein